MPRSLRSAPPRRRQDRRNSDPRQQVGHHSPAEIIDVEEGETRRDRLAAEKPCLQLVAGGDIGVDVVEQGQPCLLLALAGQCQVPDGDPVDPLGAIEVADAGQKVAEGKDAPDGEFGQAEGHGDLLDPASLAHQPGEAFPLAHFVGVEPGHVLDHRGLDGGGIVAILHDGAGQEQRLGIDIARRPPFVGDDAAGMEAAASSDDAEAAFGNGGTDQQRLDDAARADGRQDVGHVRGLAAEAHVGLVDIEQVERDMVEFHG